MNKKIEAFMSLANIFEKQGYKLYVVGGAVRDYLLHKDPEDLDVVTDATPDEVKLFCLGDFTFAKLGCVKIKHQGVTFELTTLRKEKDYEDFRHPKEITFVKSLRTDCKRRDFTINAMYMDASFFIYDYVGGRKDLEKNILRMIGNADKRIKEDPLRILRAIRFCLMYKFAFSVDLLKAITDNIDLLKELKPQKIKQELKKIEGVSRQEMDALFSRLSIHEYLDMLE